MVKSNNVVFQYAPNTRISPPYITKFEKIKLISTRAVQISKDAPVFCL